MDAARWPAKATNPGREAKDNKAVDRLGRVIEADYDPIIDDGVKANILPLQEAGVLKGKVV